MCVSEIFLLILPLHSITGLNTKRKKKVGINVRTNVFQNSRYKAFKLIGLHPLCAVLFTLGYALRGYGASGSKYLYSENDQTPLIMFILSQVFIFICP